MREKKESRMLSILLKILLLLVISIEALDIFEVVHNQQHFDYFQSSLNTIDNVFTTPALIGKVTYYAR